MDAPSSGTVWLLISVGVVFLLCVVAAFLIFGQRLQRIRVPGFELDVTGSSSEQKLNQPTSPPIVQPPRLDPPAAPVSAPPPLVTEVPTGVAPSRFMSDDYVANLAARLQMNSRAGDYLSVEDHTFDRSGDA